MAPYRHFAPVVSATPLAARVNVPHLNAVRKVARLHPIHPTGPAHPFGSQRPPANIDPLVPLAARRNICCAMGGGRGNVRSRSHSLRSCSGPAAAKPVFVKSVLENLPECAADMRPARNPGRWGQLFRCCSNGACAVLFAGRSAGPNGPPIAGAAPHGLVGQKLPFRMTEHSLSALPASLLTYVRPGPERKPSKDHGRPSSQCDEDGV
jgi:hypothetical protein